MKRFDVNSSTYINFDIESSDGDSESKVGNHVRISK